MKDNMSSNPILSQKKPWIDDVNSIWIATTVSLARNLEKYNFPGKLNADRRKQIISIISKDLLNAPQLKEPFIVKAEETSSLEKEFLVEHFLANRSFHQAHSGEAFILDRTGEFIATLNITDHIEMQFLDCNGEIENTWSRLVKLESLLGKSVNFSYLPKFGFLTADPARCGTALRVAIFMQVPALVHSNKIDDFLEKNADESLTVTGIQGNPTEIIGDILTIENNYTLGLTEENIVSSLRSFTTKLMVEENSERAKLKHSESADFKDKVSRAYGILIHSYQIEAIEALNALSLLKLGSELGWVKGASLKELNHLFFNCRRAHLLRHFDEKIEQEEVTHKRAEFIHQTLKNVSLNI